MRRAILPFKDYASYGKIKALLCEIKPDIVHTHSAKAGIIGRFAAWSLKGQWGPCGEGILPSDRGQDARDTQGRDALATKPVLRPGVVHSLHGLSFHPYQNPWASRLYIAIEKAAAKRTDYFISVADAMTEQNKAEGIGGTSPTSRPTPPSKRTSF